MSKLRTDSIEPRLASNVDFGGLDVPSWQGVPLVLPDSPSFNGSPTAPTQADSDNSTKLATTAFVKLRADNASALEATNRLATAAPLMDGTAAVGIATKMAREDHVHPHDSLITTVATGLTASLGASFFLNTPGTYSSIYTVPATGTLYYLVVGGGGGGGGGGADLSGLPGNHGTITTGSLGVTSGQLISAVVGVGGVGSPAGSNPLVITAPTAGQASSLTISSFGTLSSPGGSAGATVASSSVGGTPVVYTYYCIDTGDFANVNVAEPGLAASTISSKGGIRALNGIATAISVTGLAGNPSAINGGSGKIGGGGGGGAPSKAFVSSRGFYIDPVDGEAGDGVPTASGGNGGTGLVYFEYQAAGQPRGVTTGALELLKAELLSQGFTLSFSPTIL